MLQTCTGNCGLEWAKKQTAGELVGQEEKADLAEQTPQLVSTSSHFKALKRADIEAAAGAGQRVCMCVHVFDIGARSRQASGEISNANPAVLG